MVQKESFSTYEILRDVNLHGFVGKAKDGNKLAHAVRAIVEEEKGVAVYEG